MIRVMRTDMPKSLAEKGEKWTKELLEQIQKKNGYTNVDEKYRNKYRRADVQQSLREMYHDKCCYCEGLTGIQDYSAIEHMKPRSKFPELTYEWDNLHLCCTVCNGSKSNRWDEQNPIVDPTKDNPNNFLLFNGVTGMVDYKNERGKTTVDHAELNRDNLVQDRLKVIHMLEFMLMEGVSITKIHTHLQYTWQDREYTAFIEAFIELYSGRLDV